MIKLEVRVPAKEAVVVRFEVRSQVEAVQIARALGNVAPDAGVPDIQFVGWPQVLVTVPEGIDTFAHRKVAKLQALLRKQFSLLKYGRKRRLNASENASTTLDVSHLSPTQMMLDFSRAATAFVGAIHARIAADGARALYQQGMFGLTENDAKENWPSAAARVGLAMVRKMTPGQIAGVAIAAVIAAGLSYSATTMWKDALTYSLEAQSNTRQLPLPEINKTKVTAENGQTLAPPAHQAAESDLEQESRAVASVIIENYEGPFSGFVKLADQARPVILELAHASMLQINDLTIPAQSAKAAAKVMKQDPDYGWKAVVQAVDSSGGWKTVVWPENV